MGIRISRRTGYISRRTGYLVITGFLIVLLTGFAVLDAMAPGGRRLAKIRGVDTVNYFAISHSLLFDRDFNITNEFTRVPPDDRHWSQVQKTTGLPGSVWGVGYSIVEIPFLAVGTLLDTAVGNPPDGYSACAIYLYCLGNIFMTALGLAALFTLFCRAGESWGIDKDISTTYSLLTVFAIFFGTNVGYYAFSEVAHACTFLFSSLFLAYWWRVRSTTGSGGWLILGLIGGFLSISRWQDLIFVIGPGLF